MHRHMHIGVYIHACMRVCAYDTRMYIYIYIYVLDAG